MNDESESFGALAAKGGRCGCGGGTIVGAPEARASMLTAGIVAAIVPPDMSNPAEEPAVPLAVAFSCVSS